MKRLTKDEENELRPIYIYVTYPTWRSNGKWVVLYVYK